MSQTKYDILRGTWIYQEIQQEIQEHQHQLQIDEQRTLLYEIVQARFPRLATRVQQTAEQTKDLQGIRQLIVAISTARNEKEARLGVGSTTD